MATSKRTTDHSTIRRWAEARNGKPARVQRIGEADDAGLLRIEFPERIDDDDELEEITWDEFFEKFDDKRLAFLYQDRTLSGALSRFNRIVTR